MIAVLIVVSAMLIGFNIVFFLKPVVAIAAVFICICVGIFSQLEYKSNRSKKAMARSWFVIIVIFTMTTTHYIISGKTFIRDMLAAILASVIK